MSLVRFGGADRVLAAQASALPQPDQLCGPFAARAALHAVLEPDDVPSLVDLAGAAGTLTWPEDDPTTRPPGAPASPLPDGTLPRATTRDSSGTDAAGLAAGVIAATGGAVAVVPIRRAAPGAWQGDALTLLLSDLAGAPYPVGVVANVATGPIADDATWDVGHFVVLWGIVEETGQTAVADSYAELTGPDQPPGCRLVPVEALGEALGRSPGRGLLLLTDPEHAALLAERAVELSMVLETWHT